MQDITVVNEQEQRIEYLLRTKNAAEVAARRRVTGFFMMAETILSAGEWLALLHGTPDQYQRLVRRLAIAHGALPVEPCPTCGAARSIVTLPDGGGASLGHGSAHTGNSTEAR
jgi:hypothetical protein